MKAALALIGVLLLMSFSFASQVEPLSVQARTHGDFGRCETTGYYVFNGGWTTYSNINEGIQHDISARLARGLM